MPLAPSGSIEGDGNFPATWSGKRTLCDGSTPPSCVKSQCETAFDVSGNFPTCGSSGELQHGAGASVDPDEQSVLFYPPREDHSKQILTCAVAVDGGAEAARSKNQQRNSPIKVLCTAGLCGPEIMPAECPGGTPKPCAQGHEPFAADLLDRKDFRAASVLQLIDMLPRESGLRKVQGQGGSRLCLGAYYRAGVLHEYKNNTTLRRTCNYLCAFIHHVAPRHVFASMDILDDVQSGVHVDRFNLKRTASLVVPISEFSEGELWVEDPAGTHLLKDGPVERFGYLHSFKQGPVPL